MKDTNLLEEYVLNDQGAVFQGSSDHIGAKVWNFAQVIFEPVFDVWTIAFFCYWSTEALHQIQLHICINYSYFFCIEVGFLFLWFQFEEGVLEVCFSLLRKSHGYKVGPHMSNPVTMARAISAIVSYITYMQVQRGRKFKSSLLYKVVQNVKKDASFRFMYLVYICITKHTV